MDQRAFVFAAYAVGAYYTLAFAATLLKSLTDILNYLSLQRKIKDLVIGFEGQPTTKERVVGFAGNKEAN